MSTHETPTARSARADGRPPVRRGPGEGRPCGGGSADPGAVGRERRLPPLPGPARGRPRVDVLRGPADRERHAGHAPRRGPGLQGRVPAVQDDARATASTARPAGTATACRSSSPSRRSSASPARATSRPTASRSSTPGAGSRCCATSTSSPVLTERMGYWVDMDRRLLDDGPGLRPERVVVAEADLRQGPARPGPPGQPLLPALRHRPVRPRAGPGLRGRRRPVGVRADSRSTSGPLAERFPGVSLLVWTTTPWTLVSNTAVAVKPDATYQVVRVHRRDRRLRAAGHRRGTARGEAARGPRGPGRRCPAATWSAPGTPARSTWSTSPTPTT